MALQPPKRFWLPKAGNRPEEYEDASRVVYMGASPRVVRTAISDGASESAFAKEWAKVLADAFVARPPDLSGLTEDSLKSWLAPGQKQWSDGVPWERIPWHGEAKARAGAFATLLGLTLGAVPDNSRRLSYRAVAVGDSCLFVVRNDQLLLSFPLDEAAQFDNTPDLVCSNPANSGRVWEGVRRHSGECAPGDLFILASDALAGWFLAKNAAGEKPWETLLALDLPGWGAWVGEQRRGGLMRNDDTTLVIIKCT